jgi:indolepyruvate ferredoxin oxidoreductase
MEQRHDVGVGAAVGRRPTPELLTGVDAVVRLSRLQRQLDAEQGIDTSSVVSGYPGSPLGGVDLAVERDAKRDDVVRHVPGVNEELAAAVVWGSQQRSLMTLRDDQGVIGIWYGKSPGIDRSGDVLKHANSMGTARNGGVLVVCGDDPAAKSSSIPNDTRGAFFDAQMPVLIPSCVADIVRLGLHGIALSRFSGLWVGLKVVTDFADGFQSVVLDDLLPHPVLPEVRVDGRVWVHDQLPTVNNTVSVQQEHDILNGRLEAARAYSLANGLNRTTHDPAGARLGIAASGKAHADVLESLARLGLDPDTAGIRLFSVAMPYPLEPTAVQDFAAGLDEVLVVEEKRAFLETFVREALYDGPHQPRVLGKRGADGRTLVPAEGDLVPDRLVAVLRKWLEAHGVLQHEEPNAVPTANVISLPLAAPAPPRPARMPAFCSGCPHNRSTAGPEGAIMGGGVGCHSIVYLEERHRDTTILALTPMGAEGVPWIGAAGFASAPHMFQNLGDGTYGHSGSLAIKACLAAGVNITFKLLYNAAVAMTGAQEVQGGTDVPALTRELDAMGVGRIIVVADDPHKYGRNAGIARGVTVWGRDRLAEAERILADTPGVTVLLYDQRCAAQARRLWKRGQLVEPNKRVVINEAVCEGCGDCQKKSNCMSVVPVKTALGRKTQIHQASCNHDISCLDGDCPSFLTVETDGPAQPPKPRHVAPPADLPEPAAPLARDELSTYMVGIGGTGVVTASRVLASAALHDGWTVAGLDQTGLSQKGGSVTSHLRARRVGAPNTNTIGREGADVLFAFDPLAAAEQRHLQRTKGPRATAIVSTHVAPTSTVITQPNTVMPTGDVLRDAIAAAVGETVACDARALSEALYGDNLPANVLLLGVAYQAGALPFSYHAFEEAIGELGKAAERNLEAFAWGRAVVARPEAVAEVLNGAKPETERRREPPRAAVDAARVLFERRGTDPALREAVAWYVADLVDYQDAALAGRYLDTVEAAWAAERAAAPDRHELSEAVALHLYRLMAYKDEFEVARLHLDAETRQRIAGDYPGARVRYQLHPPLLRAMGMKRKLKIAPAVADPLFRGLHAARKLRGTALDPFGRAEVRKVERRLVEDYATRMRALTGTLTADGYERALDVAKLPEMVRGYEDVKLANVAEYEAILLTDQPVGM